MRSPLRRARAAPGAPAIHSLLTPGAERRPRGGTELVGSSADAPVSAPCPSALPESDEGSDLRSKLRGLSSSERNRLFLAPEEVLGPWEELPRSDRASLRSAVEAWDEASTRGYRTPHFWPAVRSLWRLRRRCLRAGGTLGRMFFKAADEAAFALRKAPIWGGRYLARARHVIPDRLPALSTDTDSLLGPVLSRRLSPHLFAACYCRSVRQRPRYRAFWRDPGADRTVGCIVGLDLMPADDGYYVLESNLNPAQRLERTRLYDRDPFADNLVDHAARAGFAHLFVLDNRQEGINPSTARQYRERATRRGIHLTIFERPHRPETSHCRSFGLPDDPPAGSLAVRLKSYPVSTDHVLSDKFATHRALSLFEEAFDEPHLRLPRAGVEPVLANHPPGSPFPNVVAKQSDAAHGHRVLFAKAESPGHAARLFAEPGASRFGDRPLTDRIKDTVRTPATIYQEYVRPSLLEGERPYIVRAHVLLIPGDVVFLSAHRVVSDRSVPDRLEPGIVENPDPYIVNFSTDSAYEVLPSEEERDVERAALAAGRGLAWALRRGFKVEA